jgi:hypothetical protein
MAHGRDEEVQADSNDHLHFLHEQRTKYLALDEVRSLPAIMFTLSVASLGSNIWYSGTCSLALHMLHSNINQVDSRRIG